jgi:hypothetical protein
LEAVTVGGGGRGMKMTEDTSPHFFPQMNLYGLRWLMKSITNSKYLCLCMHGSVLLSSYPNCVECNAFGENNFH